MKRRFSLYCFLTIIPLILLSSCASSELSSVWKDSSYQGGPIRKVLIIGVFQEQESKKTFEDEFARQMKSKGVDAVPGYSVFPEEEMIAKERIDAKTKELGIDALFLARFVSVKETGEFETYPPFVSGGLTYYEYYAFCCQNYVGTGHNVMIETKMFEVERDRLIWSAMSETSLDRYIVATAKSFTSAVIEDLVRQGLIQ